MKTPTVAVDLGEALWAIILARVVVYWCDGDGGSELGFEAFGSSKKAQLLIGGIAPRRVQ
jgi:hypothetical protein